MEIKIKGIQPQYQSKGASGFDLEVKTIKKLYSGNTQLDLSTKLTNAHNKGHFFLRPFERVLIGTGLYMELPEGYELQIRDRSSVSLKRGLLVANSPGTVDSDYRGEIMVAVVNATNKINKIQFGERIAQGVIMKVERGDFKLVTEFTATERNDGGFGSTG